MITSNLQHGGSRDGELQLLVSHYILQGNIHPLSPLTYYPSDGSCGLVPLGVGAAPMDSWAPLWSSSLASPSQPCPVTIQPYSLCKTDHLPSRSFPCFPRLFQIRICQMGSRATCPCSSKPPCTPGRGQEGAAMASDPGGHFPSLPSPGP